MIRLEESTFAKAFSAFGQQNSLIAFATFFGFGVSPDFFVFEPVATVKNNCVPRDRTIVAVKQKHSNFFDVAQSVLFIAMDAIEKPRRIPAPHRHSFDATPSAAILQ